MKRILVVNDDGINSPGLWALARAVRDLGEVTIIAPRTQRSGSGVSLTIRRPLRVERVRMDGFESFIVDGTPADCIILGLNCLLPETPRVVLSGYNIGANISLMAPLSSGTIGAAIEAALNSIPAAALSFEVRDIEKALLERSSGINYEGARRVTRLIARYLLDKTLPEGIHLLNICFPCQVNAQTRVEITHLAPNYFKKEVLCQKDPYGIPYYWIRVRPQDIKGEDNSDVYCLHRQESISITPLAIDLSHNIRREALEDLGRSLYEMLDQGREE